MIHNLFEQARKSRTYALAVGLYILTFFLGGVAFLAARRMVLSTYTRLFPDAGALQLVNILTTMALVVPFIGVVIGGFEYHYRRVGQESSWRLFARTLAAELAVLLLALYM